METLEVSNAIVYLLSGPAHLPYLVASLHTLRRWWNGPVLVYAWPESYPIVQQIAQDNRLRIQPIEWNPEYRGKNAQFLCKIKVMQNLPVNYQIGLYLDADTTIHGDLQPLFDRFDADPKLTFLATQFGGWTVQQGIIQRRIQRLRTVTDLPQEAVEQLIASDLPSVNGGVFAARSDSVILQQWQKWTEQALRLFIADETVLHLITSIAKGLSVATGGVWNCSPKYQPADLADSDVVVRHYHGDSNVRPDKCQKGCNLWMPIFGSCVKQNIGNCQDWIDEAMATNKFLKDYSL